MSPALQTFILSSFIFRILSSAFESEFSCIFAPPFHGISHSSDHSINNSPNHSLIHSFMHSFSHLPTHPFIPSIAHQSIHPMNGLQFKTPSPHLLTNNFHPSSLLFINFIAPTTHPPIHPPTLSAFILSHVYSSTRHSVLQFNDMRPFIHSHRLQFQHPPIYWSS